MNSDSSEKSRSSSSSHKIDINLLLKLMIEKKASDLFITTGFPPSFKIHGNIYPVGKESLSSAQTRALAYSVMEPEQREEFDGIMNVILQ